MKILAIGAHPDDIEIFMYGLLYLLKKRGDKIFLAIATDGSLGGNDSDKNLVNLRKAESQKALNKIGEPYFFNFKDGQLGNDTNHKMKIYEYISKIKPNFIITHYKKDYHSDHRTLSKIVSQIAGHFIPVIYCDTMMGVNFKPKHYVDITKVFEEKKKAVSFHKTQQPKRFLDLIELMNSYRSAQCNAPKGSYAEAYYFERSFPFCDVKEFFPAAPKLRMFDIKNQKGFL